MALVREHSLPHSLSRDTFNLYLKKSTHIILYPVVVACNGIAFSLFVNEI